MSAAWLYCMPGESWEKCSDDVSAMLEDLHKQPQRIAALTIGELGFHKTKLAAGTVVMVDPSSMFACILSNDRAPTSKAVRIRREIPDSAAEACLTCKKKFSFFTRRHHCRGCGNIYCSDCLCYPTLMPGPVGGAKETVCAECSQQLKVTMCPDGTCSNSFAKRALELHIDYVCTSRQQCPKGCGAEPFPSARLAKHRAKCPMEDVPCPKCCGATVRRQDVPTHEKVCTHRLVTCPNACNENLLARDLDAHCRESCPNRIVLCIENCGARMKFCDRGEHIRRECPTREKCECGELVAPSMRTFHQAKECNYHIVTAVANKVQRIL